MRTRSKQDEFDWEEQRENPVQSSGTTPTLCAATGRREEKAVTGHRTPKVLSFVLLLQFARHNKKGDAR
jgi:hypothetical protein